MPFYVFKTLLLISLLGINVSLYGVVSESDGLAIFNAYGSQTVEYVQHLPGSGADDEVALYAVILINTITWWLLVCLPYRIMLGTISGLNLIAQFWCLMWIETDSAYRILSDTLRYTDNGYLWAALFFEIIYILLSAWAWFTAPNDA